MEDVWLFLRTSRIPASYVVHHIIIRGKSARLSKYTPRCFPAITSRDPLSFKRDDLADRLFMIILLRREEFIPESDLNRRIITDRNAMWRELLTNLNKIIHLINDGGLPAPCVRGQLKALRR